ncbi:SDR family oxidoreductase [Micromonosporaceae bacterium B7E4]
MMQGKVAIVTGAARGIGRQVAETLAGQGAAVVLNDLDSGLAEQAAKEIDGDVAVFGGDLTSPEAPDRLVRTAIDAFGRLDIVVNNAGYTVDAPIHKMPDDDFQAMLDIHVVAPFRVLRAAAPYLREPAKRERQAGQEVFRKVVNVSSVAGTMGNAGQANYSSAKSAVIGLTKTLAKEWGQFRINVNAVAFGFIDTRLTVVKTEDTVIELAGRQVRFGIPKETRAAIEAVIPLGRAGTVVEAAGAVAFLCSPWSDYVHGQVLNVTGGLAAGMDG